MKKLPSTLVLLAAALFGLGGGSSPDGNLSLFGVQFSAGIGF